LCLIPAFFIAGAVAVFISPAAVIKYLGAQANKITAYSVAAVSGSVLAVCSCTILPLFAGIYRQGAGVGPATTFLYAGPAINVLAIILTARVLGMDIGIARAVGAILFSVAIGLIMHVLFRKAEGTECSAQPAGMETEVKLSLGKNGVFFFTLIAILVFANWAKPESTRGIWYFIYSVKWIMTGLGGIGLAVILTAWFKHQWRRVFFAALPVIILSLILPGKPGVAFFAGMAGLSLLISKQDNEGREWFQQTWGFAKQILPLLFMGVLIAGLLLGTTGQEGLIPSDWVAKAVGGNSWRANFFAAFAGAFMYFATLTEVPILQGLLGTGMGKGPALALLLAGPALSLPNMLVIRSVLGTKKTIVFICLVIIMSMISGVIFGSITK
ncbi:permease, partial [bacterium]|nr:permease [bacterium]